MKTISLAVSCALLLIVVAGAASAETSVSDEFDGDVWQATGYSTQWSADSADTGLTSVASVETSPESDDATYGAAVRTPEPCTWVLLAASGVIGGVLRRRRK